MFVYTDDTLSIISYLQYCGENEKVRKGNTIYFSIKINKKIDGYQECLLYPSYESFWKYLSNIHGIFWYVKHKSVFIEYHQKPIPKNM